MHQKVGMRMTPILTDSTDYLGHSVSQWKTVYHSVDALRASEYRHTDDPDLNGFHGYLGHRVSQWKTVYHSVDALRASGRRYTHSTD